MLALRLSLALAAGFLSACATMENSPYQEIKITSRPAGATVRLEPKGLEVTTPAMIQLGRRSEQTLHFELDGYRPATANLYRRQTGDGWPLGIPGLVDDVTGAAWELVPNPVHVELVSKDSAAHSAASPKGLFFVNGNHPTSVVGASAVISLDVDGERVAMLDPHAFIWLDLASGRHEFAVAHWDVWTFEDTYSIDVGDSAQYIVLSNGVISTKAKIADSPPRGFPELFGEMGKCAGETCDYPKSKPRPFRTKRGNQR
jgi:hypothetical protein